MLLIGIQQTFIKIEKIGKLYSNHTVSVYFENKKVLFRLVKLIGFNTNSLMK